MNNDVRVRPITAETPVQDVAGLYQRCAAEGGPAGMTPEAIAALAKARGVLVLVAEYSRTPVGAAVVHLPGAVPTDEHSPAWFHRKDVAVLDRLAVEPALRNMGIAAEVINAAQERCVEWGPDELAAAVPESLPWLVAAFTKRGFRPVDKTTRGSQRCVVLSKRLSADAAAA